MSFDFLEFLKSLVSLTISDYLRELWGNQPWVDFLMNVLGVVILSTFCLLIVIFLIWLERKVIARIQRRIGPNRVGGRYGLLQTVADVIKLLIKEDITPTGADKVAYLLAPFLTVMAALMVWAVMPFAPNIIGVDLNIGIFYFLAISSVSVVALLLAGWGSNNKYALLGAFRSVAQLVSYEVPMILALLVPILLARSMSTVDIVNAQTVPYLIVAPLAALIFFISSLAETGRTPFDLLEAESEIVAGFHVEYGGMKFGMFFLAEFVSTLFMSGFFATVFLGGYRLFGLETLVIGDGWVIGNLLGLIIFFVKMFAVYFVYIWIRGTLPRVRVDQILNFNWKFLVPVSLALVMMTAVLDKLLPDTFNDFARAGAHLLANIILAMITIEILRSYARRQRKLASDDGAAETASGHDDHGHHEPAHEPVAAH
ncbi:MAG: NADH-quinone oxidoreductase subunit NuoH [Chloroflexi bacterium]|nr:NADH-quinone oxidoreductase subunit NuoH [Chloroflexota bacterium]MBK6712919.1 NADH-quinone oxidoreductase subunit NuoH [Chloroflexota bacterium]MBK7177475.1 NADH-quinone oxidoreductase subunit NuoH [Chloroflexota bacterium]MBK8931913.1 NADH-quinone oxidoreductase subunit NuoH [Chloroflexota bacterium]MBP6804084.1 NADH-quinone oxidoreductase subunit NuoH [Chloroflexota bacterium]